MREIISAISAISARPLLLARRVYSTQIAQIAQKYYLLCKYLVYAATRGIFPKENISAVSAISARQYHTRGGFYRTQKSRKPQKL